VNILSRRTDETLFARHLFANPQLWLAVLISLAVVVVIVSVPVVGLWLEFGPMRLDHWIWPFAGALAFLLCFKVKKLLRHRASKL